MDCYCICFFFNDTATTEIYTLSLHDALPILAVAVGVGQQGAGRGGDVAETGGGEHQQRGNAESRVRPPPARPAVAHALFDRKSTRSNSSHANISYVVFFLLKKILFYTYPGLP